VIIDADAHERQLPDRNRLLPGIAIADGVDLTGLADGFHTIGLLAALRGATSPADDETTLRVRTPSVHRPRPRRRSRPGSGSARCGTGT
jgi:hypothetical protein